MEIRLARKDDSKRICELLEYIFKFHHKNRNDLFVSSKFNLEEVNKLINSENYKIFVCDKSNYVVGYVFIKNIIAKNNKKVLYVEDLCVDELYQSLGIGRALMEKVKEYAVENDYDRVELNVYSFNKNAVKFYKSLGYTPQRVEMEIILK